MENQKKSWSIRRAILAGLILQSLGFAASNISDGGADLSKWLSAPPRFYIPYIIGQFAPVPILFAIIAVIRNLAVRKLRRSKPASVDPVLPETLDNGLPGRAARDRLTRLR